MARRRNKNRIAHNQYIRAKKVRVIDEKGDQIGIMPTKEGIAKAKKQDKDLVLVTGKADPPVAKIIELNKFKYQQQQKRAASRKKARSQDIKEVRFTPFMGEGDFKARLKRVKRFLNDGDKVRLSLLFKGRAITKKEFGYEIFADVIKATKNMAEIEMEPKMMGKKLIAQLMPTKT